MLEGLTFHTSALSSEKNLAGVSSARQARVAEVV